MAIAFDTSESGGEVNPDTSLTWSHTCNGSDRLLVVTVRGGGGQGDRITGITYDGDAMTKVTNITVPGDNVVLSQYYLLNPSSGAKNVVVSLASGFMEGDSASYTGVKQSGQPDNSGTKTQEDNATISTNLTPVLDNCWIIVSNFGPPAEPTAVAGVTKRQNQLFDSNAPITPAAAHTVTIGGGDEVLIQA